jgi:hypothetical protein
MSPGELAMEIAEVALGAAKAGIASARNNGSADEALMAMIEHIQNERAKEKFVEFREG